MKRASITEAKNGLSALIDSVRGGASVLIMDRGRPVARLEPIAGQSLDQDGRLSRLIREGVIRPARARLTKSAIASEPPRPRGNASALAALIEERRTGR
jgi:prevent-host-death family protein